jgi:hypothetical protein
LRLSCPQANYEEAKRIRTSDQFWSIEHKRASCLYRDSCEAGRMCAIHGLRPD